MIKKFIKENKPFAIVKYYEWLKGTKERNETYELISFDVKYGRQSYVLDRNLVAEFFSVKDKLTFVVSNSDGAVWEFNDFKDFYTKVKSKYALRRSDKF